MKFIPYKILDKGPEPRKANANFWVPGMGIQIRKDKLSYPHETTNVH
jgi:hypothetical protein